MFHKDGKGKRVIGTRRVSGVVMQEKTRRGRSVGDGMGAGRLGGGVLIEF
jgi:hypothetical protein